VLPHDKELPPGRCESSGVSTVTLDVALELREPVGGVRPRRDAVDRAAMPEAAEALHGYPLPRKQDVRPEANARHERHMFAKAQATAMQLSSERNLVASIP